jgi:hypothetical protein
MASSRTAGQPQFGAYASAKEAIRGMSKVAALEWGADNIRVNVVCPLANSDGKHVFSEVAPKEDERVVRGVPVRRIGDTREDVGAVVAFLMSDEASYLTVRPFSLMEETAVSVEKTGARARPAECRETRSADGYRTSPISTSCCRSLGSVSIPRSSSGHP